MLAVAALQFLFKEFGDHSLVWQQSRVPAWFLVKCVMVVPN
jgi:hypothetical protein